MDSILRQTLRSFEVVVVDDGSTDRTPDILREISDERLTVIRQENAGQGLARNRGIEVARGKYLGFVDADDTVLPQMYEDLFAAAEHSAAEVAQCGIIDIRGDRRSVRACVEDGFIEIMDRGQYIFEYAYGLKYTYEACNKLYLKSFIMEHGLRFGDTRIYHCEDLKFNLDVLSQLRRVCFLPAVYYEYFISPAGHNRAMPGKKVRGLMRIYSEVLAAQEDRGVRRSFQCIAAVMLLCECAKLLEADPETAELVLNSSLLRGCIRTSMTHRSNVLHAALMAALLLTPSPLRRYLVRRKFSFGEV